DSLDTPPAIIGHSLGGLVSLKAGLADADAFHRVMVIDVLPFFSVLMDPASTSESMAGTATYMTSVLLMQDDATFAARQGEALQALTKVPEMAEQSLEWSIATDRAVMAQAMKEVLVTDLRLNMSGFSVPLTVLYARDPGVLNMDVTEALYLNDYAPVPEVEIYPVDGALHFVMTDQPDAFHAAVETFLSAP
ncbi:MAG: alpha/beta hydrolase, partial [Pseudomonadota bacterium]